MNTSNEKFSLILLDVPGRPWPSPSTGRLDVADLLHWVGKARHFGDDEAGGTEAAGAVVSLERPRAVLVFTREALATVRMGP